MEYKDMKLEMLEDLKNDLIGRYIGDFDKPEYYYRKLEALNSEINKRKLSIK